MPLGPQDASTTSKYLREVMGCTDEMMEELSMAAARSRHERAVAQARAEGRTPPDFVPPLRLRGHHFICLQFFRGEGYSKEFVRNLKRVVKRAHDERAIVVGGADDVCAKCPGLRLGVCVDPNAGEDEVTRLDRFALELLGVQRGDDLSLAQARERLAADAVGVGEWRTHACGDCTWIDVCEPGWDELLGEG